MTKKRRTTAIPEAAPLSTPYHPVEVLAIPFLIFIFVTIIQLIVFLF